MQPELLDTSPRYTVTDLTRRLRRLLEATPALQDIWVLGEISNFSRPSSGHVYFSIKDASAQLRCVIWRSDASRLKIAAVDGLLVEAHGNLSLYEAGGQYQLYVDQLRPVGEGALYAEYLRLKALLESEGLFVPERKRPIPERSRRIGIVTSPTGAALRDILTALQRRYPLAQVILAPTPVQGVEAPSAIAAALGSLNLYAAPDVILLARGGGSMEDLWAFNDERVVRAVAASTAPIISGVGHETDFTLADFAADLRAPTPTAAAELATSVTVMDLRSDLEAFEDWLTKNALSTIQVRKETLGWQAQRLRLASPVRLLQGERQRLDDLNHRLLSARRQNLTLASAQLAGLKNRLGALNPLAVLRRGYAVITSQAEGRILTRIEQVHPGEVVHVRLQDGTFTSRVLEKEDEYDQEKSDRRDDL